jgi:hypothetical protein
MARGMTLGVTFLTEAPQERLQGSLRQKQECSIVKMFA